MESAKLNDWMQVIGIFAVVASLIFVGLQMRQDQEIAQATLYQMRSDSARELGMVVLENPELREVLFRAMNNDSQELSLKDEMLVSFNCQTIFGHFENSHHLFQLGFLSTEQWAADRSQMALMLNGMCKQAWTEQQRSTFRKSFVEEVDTILQN